MATSGVTGTLASTPTTAAAPTIAAPGTVAGLQLDHQLHTCKYDSSTSCRTTPTMTAAQGTVTAPMTAATGTITSDATVRGQLEGYHKIFKLISIKVHHYQYS